MARSPREIFEAQSQALEAGDLDKVAADYSEDCIQIWNGQPRRGRAGVKEGFAHFFAELGEVKALEEPVQVFEEGVLYLEWWADLGERRCDGVDTVVFKDGQITVHTIKYEIKEVAPRGGERS